MLFKGRGEPGLKLVTAAACLLLSGPAVAAQAGAGEGSLGAQPARELLALCGRSGGTTMADTLAAHRCRAFIDGFVWGHGWAAWRGATDMWFCLPQAWTIDDLVPAVIGYLERHPERMDEDTHLLVFTALSQAYPCRQ
jgi:hypothetical protein